MAAMVNMSNLLNGKDSRWLQLEVCREFQRNKCSRPDTECKFAHPPANVEVQNGRVTACYDSIKGRCNREKPPCKYFHPPQHLKDQLLINGRNHLALKNALMQQMGMAPSTTPTPTIIPSPLQPMTANRFLPASNPYNPYFTTGTLLPTTIIGPEHAALTSNTSPLPQAMPLAGATNNAAQPQLKRTDRVQSTPTTSSTLPTSNGNSITNSSVPLISSASILANLVESGKKRTAECLQMYQMNLTSPYCYDRFLFPGLMPYNKRPAPDGKPTAIQAMYHQPSAAYQQLIQLQSAAQQSAAYVPVSSHQNSINQSSPSSKAIIIPSNIIDNNSLSKATSNVNAVAAATSSSSVATPVDHDGGDSENALIVQNAKNIINNANGIDVSVAAAATIAVSSTSSSNGNNNSESVTVVGGVGVEENNNKSINDNLPNGTTTTTDLSQQQQQSNINNHIDDATKTSIVQSSSIDESNLNAISFNSAISSSQPAATTTLSALYTTSSGSITASSNINNNNYNFSNNNSILSRKNSLTTPNQQLINSNSSSKAPLTNSGKVDSLPDLINNASTLNNQHLLSAVFYNQPYHHQQLALTQNLYSDPAQLAKEMAQKNYANALKLAAAAQSPSAAAHMAAATKNNPTNPFSYSGVALSANNSNAMLQPGTSANQRLSAPTRSPFNYASLTRPMQNPYQQFIRPQMPHVNLTNAAAANPYYAAAHQQFLNQQNFLYSGLTSPIASPQLTATSGAPSQTQQQYVNSYPFTALSQAQAQSFQAAAAAAAHAGLPASMMQVPQITSQSSQTGNSSAVLNPYKKMKTS